MSDYDQQDDDPPAGTSNVPESFGAELPGPLSAFAHGVLANEPYPPEQPVWQPIALTGEPNDPSPPNQHSESSPARPLDSTRLRLIVPKKRPKVLDKPWHDMRLFTHHHTTTTTTTSCNGEVMVNFDTNEPPPTDWERITGEYSEEVPPSRTARRLSLIPDGSVGSVQHGEACPPGGGRRRNSLTPLSYFSDQDAVEQFMEQSEELTWEDATPMPVERRSSAEHFLVPRHSICAGIKIEIIPPSAFREVNNFILDTVIIEVRDDDDHSPDLPDELSRVVNVQQLASSSTELRTISPVLSVASVLQNSPQDPPLTEAVPQPLTHVDSVVVVPPPARRRTKLIAINVRRQTLSAVPRVQKTVRFAPSPTRGIEYMVDESESLMLDRHPHIWTDEMAGGMETADQLETESEEPFTLGLLRVYDFSGKELQQVMGRVDNRFAEERSALVRFFEAKLVGVPAVQLEALGHSELDGRSSDVDMLPDKKMDKSGTRREWDQFGGSAGSNSGNTYPSGPPDFTKPASGGAPDFSRTTTSSDSYSTSQTVSGSGANQSDMGQPMDNQFNDQVPPTGLMGHVATATETAKVAALNAVEGGKNLARQASEGAKNLASGAWDKISSLTGPKP